MRFQASPDFSPNRSPSPATNSPLFQMLFGAVVGVAFGILATYGFRLLILSSLRVSTYSGPRLVEAAINIAPSLGAVFIWLQINKWDPYFLLRRDPYFVGSAIAGSLAVTLFELVSAFKLGLFSGTL